MCHPVYLRAVQELGGGVVFPIRADSALVVPVRHLQLFLANTSPTALPSYTYEKIYDTSVLSHTPGEAYVF